MKDWDKMFNEMPKKYRRIACKSSLNDQTRYLKREKIRLKKSYDRNIKEINAHIKNLERALEKERSGE